MTSASRESRSFGFREAISYAVLAGAVWLAWETIKAPLADRGPPALAVRLAPTSPEVLRRAAEVELREGRIENAAALSLESLSRAPFNARALRVHGLAEAREGDLGRADEMLTLAGNWSLRDDPAHSWLIENRLRRGDYGSAFAHADTLARRRMDLYPALFNLFTTAALQDSRSLPVLVRLLAAKPPWRQAYLVYLHDNAEAAPVVGALAVALESTDAPFTALELQRLYIEWVGARRYQGLREVRARIGRPPIGQPIQNGDFSTDLEAQSPPFGWNAGTGAGMIAGVANDDLRNNNPAFRVEYDGFGTGVVLEQMTMLEPGAYVLTGNQRIETGTGDLRMEWRLDCSDNAGASILRPAAAGGGEWVAFSANFVVPAENCPVQWLRLAARPEDRRTALAVWYDDLSIRSTNLSARSGSPSAEPRQ